MSNTQNFKQQLGRQICPLICEHSHVDCIKDTTECPLNSFYIEKLLSLKTQDGLRLAIVKDTKDELTGCNNENDYCDDELKCDGCQYKIVYLEEAK